MAVYLGSNQVDNGITGGGGGGVDLVFEADEIYPIDVTSATLESGSYADAVAKVNDGGYLTAVVHASYDNPVEIDRVTFGTLLCAYMNYPEDEDEYIYVLFTDGNSNQGLCLYSDGTIGIGI